MNAEKQAPSRYHGRRSRTVPASFLDSEETSPARNYQPTAAPSAATERLKTPRRAPIPVSLLDEEERARARSHGQRAAVAAVPAAAPITTRTPASGSGLSRNRSVTAPAQQYDRISSSRPPPLPTQHQPSPVPSSATGGSVHKSNAEESSGGGLTRTRSRYRRAQNTATVEQAPPVPTVPSVPAIPSSAPAVAPSLPSLPSSSVAPKLAPINLSRFDTSLSDEIDRSQNQQRQPHQQRRTEPLKREISSSGSASSSDSKEGVNYYIPEPEPNRLVRANTAAQHKSRELTIRLGKSNVVKLKAQPGATVGDVLDQACELPPKSLRGAAVLVERANNMQVERGLHEAELVSTIVDGWENNQQDKELYLVIDIARSAMLRPLSSTDSVTPPPLSDYFYYGCGTDAKFNRSKRHIMLEEGKLVVSKKEHEKEKSRGIVAKMDLLLFGVYMAQDPTKSYLFGAPKKYVIVLKSLEKASQFLDTSRYIHYFSTKDPELYKKWVDGLSKARNCLLEKRDRAFSKGKSPAPSRDGHNAPPPLPAGGIRRSVDYESRPPTTGTRSRSATMSKRTRDEAGPLLKDDGPADFLSSGLLGKLYDKKKEEQEVRERNDQLPNGHLFSPTDDHLYNADSLLSKYKTNQSTGGAGGGNDRSRRTSMDSSRRTSMDHENTPLGMLSRSKSTRSVKGRMPQPLVSFNEEAPPLPPQHKLRGRGYTVDKSEGPLIQHATQPTHGMDPKSPPVVGRQRGMSLSASKYNSQADVVQSPEEMLFPSPFQASSLLASLPDAKMTSHRGHGVATGSRSATQPLMDMSLQSQFVPGSLLAMKEQRQDGGPTYHKTNICRVEGDD